VKRWTIEQDNAKHDRHKSRWMKPKMPTMEKAPCKPLLADFNTAGTSSDDEEEDGDEIHGNHMQMSNGDSD
jgi:hypothetical protein